MIDALGGRRGSPDWLSQAQLSVFSTLVTYEAPSDDTSLSDVSRASDVSISAYLRLQAPAAGQKADMGNDILLGRLDLRPILDPNSVRFPNEELSCTPF